MEIQVSVNIGGSAVGVVWRLNWTGSVIVTSPNYNEVRVLANLPQRHSRSGTQYLKFYSLCTSLNYCFHATFSLLKLFHILDTAKYVNGFLVPVHGQYAMLSWL